MIRQLLGHFAVTLAFIAGAAITELLLELPAVRALLGLPSEAAISLPGLAGYFSIAVLAGLIVDGLRFSATRWWGQNRQLEHDLEDLFTSNLT